MKRHTVRLCIAFACAGALFTNPVAAQEKPAQSPVKTKAGPPGMEEMMKKAEAAGAPGVPHRNLQAMVGEWNVEAKCFMAPEAPPTVNQGTAKVQAILGGRYVQEEFSGEFMGKPFKGIGITGYDNLKQKYTSVWIDDMSTAMFTSEGTADSGNKVFTFQGRMSDAMSGQTDKPMNCILRIISADKHTFEMHDLSLGDKSRIMELTYTRK